jgi:hypothetical protein
MNRNQAFRGQIHDLARYHEQLAAAEQRNHQEDEARAEPLDIVPQLDLKQASPEVVFGFRPVVSRARTAIG